MKKIIGINFAHDASISIFEDNTLIRHIELEKDDNERYARAKSIDFFLKWLNFPLEEIDLICISGSYKKMFNLDSDTYNLHDPIQRGTLVLNGEKRDFLIPWVAHPHVMAHMAGTNMMSGASDYSIVWDGGVVPTICSNGKNGTVEYFKIAELFQMSGLVYSIIGYYFGKFKDLDVISGKSCHSLHNVLYGNYSIPGNYMSYASLGTVDTVKSAEIMKRILSFEKNAYGFNEHKLMKYCLGLEFDDDTSAIKTIHTAIETIMMKAICKIVPLGSTIAVSGGCFLNIKLNHLIQKEYKLLTTPVMNDSGGSINAVCAHLSDKGYISINYSNFIGLEMKNADVLKGLEVSQWGVGKILNSKHVVMSLFGRSEIGPRALGNRSLLCLPFKGARDKLNKIKRREDYRPVSPIINKQFMKDNMRYEIHDHYMTIENYSKFDKIGEEYVHVDGSVRALLSTGKIINGIVDSVGGCVLNTSANELGKGFFNDYKIAIEWASMNGIEYLFDGDKVYKIPAFNPYAHQVGGKHYKSNAIPLAVFARSNDLDVAATHAIKYLMRHKAKDGIKDLRKAIHSIELYMFDLYGDKDENNNI